MTLFSGAESSFVRIASRHTNIVSIKKNGESLFDGKIETVKENKHLGLSVEEIVKFADSVEIDDIKDTLDRQINFNMAIANEGINGNWGANIGKV